MTTDPLGWCSLPAEVIADAVSSGRATAAEVVEAHLTRLEAIEPGLRMFAHVATDDARNRAAAVDRAPSGLVLAGVPIGVKDVIDTARMPTAHGTPVMDGNRPTQDAAIVTRVERSGAVVIGKTVTNEFGASNPGPTCNPHDPARTPGGSSSGSAASVAAGVVTLALGTQTGGSVVRPASFCGVFGLKPTFGSIDRTGVGGHCPTIDTPGLFARSASDLALLLSVVADLPQGSPKGSSIGLVLPEGDDPVDPSLRAGLQRIAASARERGIEVVVTGTPSIKEPLRGAPQIIIRYELAEHLGHLLDTHRSSLSERLIASIEHGRRIPTGEYEEARSAILQAREDLRPHLSGFDALMSLTVPHEAPLGRSESGDPAPHRIWSALGVPVLNVPLLTGPSGLPIGVQLVGMPRSDAWLLEVAASLKPVPDAIVPR
jgi:Asp-tRNA(Asn)/Glu-tRNA(Gln) amidotransferase A subunit family amidase